MNKLFVALLTGLIFSGSSFGQCVPSVDCAFAPFSSLATGSSKVSETRWYTGLIWEIGGNRASNMPDFAF